MLASDDLREFVGAPAQVVDGNLIFNHGQLDPGSVKIRFSGKGNIVFIPQGVEIKNTHVDFRSSNGIVFLGSNHLRARVMVGHGSVVYVGAQTTFTSACQITAAEGRDVLIGERCTIAENVYITNTDGHPIFDEDGTRINPGRDIFIGESVWIGRNVQILKGARVHSGSVIGANSILTKAVPANSLSVGAPARILRRNISFSRQTTVRHPAAHFDGLGKPALFAEDHLPGVELLPAIRALAADVLVR